MGGICRVGWKLIAVLATVMWGCTDVDYKEAEHRSYAKVVGFIDDSLVMVEDYRYWYEDRETWNGVYSEKSGCENTRLCVYNYRVQEDGPRWCDSSDGRAGYSGQLADSIVWYGIFGSRSSLQLWKVGEDHRRHYGLEVITEGCSASFDAAKAHQWFDGKFIVIGKQSLTAGNDSCQYAVLDTVARTLVYKRLEENLKWIEKCDDVRAWGEDVYCSVPGEHQLEGIILKNNVDTLAAPLVFSRGIFWGDMIELRASLCNLKYGKISCLDTSSIWRGDGVKFYQGNVIIVEY